MNQRTCRKPGTVGIAWPHLFFDSAGNTLRFSSRGAVLFTEPWFESSSQQRSCAAAYVTCSTGHCEVIEVGAFQPQDRAQLGRRPPVYSQ